MKNLTIKPIGLEHCEYSPVILAMMEQMFPGSQQDRPDAILEALTGILVGTKQYRYGPTPSPETLVSIRQVIRHAIEMNDPIPMLVAWGASKQGPFGIDLSELVALGQLSRVQSAVNEHYKHGLQIVIRVEDITDAMLFSDANPAWKYKTQEYVEKIVPLARMVLPDATIVTESELEQFSGSLIAMARRYVDPLFNAINNPTGRMPSLSDIGWSGDMPDEQIEYYRRAYTRFYPGKSAYDIDYAIAQYFAMSLARGRMNLTGASMFTSIPLLAGFSLPIPGASQYRRLYYRTIPERFTNMHRAPWLGKGYIRIRGNEATPAIAGWDGDGVNYHRYEVAISKGDQSVNIEADYTVLE